MSDRQPLSPMRHNEDLPPYGASEHNGRDFSDEDYPARSHGREKFRRERSIDRDQGYYGRAGDDYGDRYDRKKRIRRSVTPPDDRRHIKRRASLTGGYSRGMPSRGSHERDLREGDYRDGDHYIPNYDRDGYSPAPRYSSMPEHNNSFSGASGSASGGHGYPVMDMINPSVMGGNNWSMGRMPPVDIDQLDYVVSFKQFTEYLRHTHPRSHFDDDEIQKRYGRYKEKVTTKQLAAFFEANKDKQWFQEKYHPSFSQDRSADVKRRRRLLLDEFLKDLKDGKYDNVLYDASPQKQDEDIKEATEEPHDSTADSTDAPAEELVNHLVIKTVPPTIARQKIIEMCQGVEGFDSVVLSEPSPLKKFHRVGWIHFKEGTDMRKAFTALDNQKIDDFTFHLALNKKDHDQQRPTKFAPEATGRRARLQQDFSQAQELARALELELGDDVNALEAVLDRAKEVIANQKDTETDKPDEWEQKKELDMVLAYLRRVHMYCYYCSMECDSSEDLNRRCADPHVRKVPKESEDAVDSKQASRAERAANQLLRTLDQKIHIRTHTPDDAELQRMGGKSEQKEIDAFIEAHVQKEHEAKFKCRVLECSKAFKGFEFVEKHIRSKHPEQVDKIKEEVRFYNNYVCDPNHLIQSGPQQPQQNANGIPFPSFMIPGVNGNMRPPPGLGAMQAAAMGTPYDQIPRIGFSGNLGPRGRAGGAASERFVAAAAVGGGAGRAGMDLDEPMPRDPRQVKSYVDLDAPAEGDANISFF